MSIDIQSRALTVKLHVSTWTARRFDKKVTDKVNTEHAAGRDAGRYNKHLLGGPDTSLNKVISAATAARALHDVNALPWSDKGWRLLPSTNYFQYTEQLRKARVAFEAAVDQFVSDYTALKEQAKVRLNGLYNEADYPAESEVRGKFEFALHFAPLPAQGDFRLALPADQIAELEKSITDRVESAVKDAMTDTWSRVYEAVARIHRLVADPAINEDSPTGQAKRAAIRDAIVKQTTDTTDLVARLNVVDDANLEVIRTRVAREIMTLSPKLLRETGSAAETLRADAAARTQSILDAMSGFYEPPAEQE
jgi:hypothetical protein